MQLLIEGVDITDMVTILDAIYTDTEGEMDLLELTLTSPSRWRSWQPLPDERLQLLDAGSSLNTGRLYISAVLPEGDRYRLWCTGAPRSAREKKSAAYTNMTLQQAVDMCTGELGMENAIWAMDGAAETDFILRCRETPLQFLSRIAALEGGIVKTADGKVTVIGLEWAQNRQADRRWTVQADGNGASVQRLPFERYASLTVQGGAYKATAWDTAAQGGAALTLSGMNCTSYTQARRQAQNLLLMKNRKAEELTLHMGLCANMGAAQRVHIDSLTDANGEWMVRSARHDIVGGTSSLCLVRVIDTIE